MYQTTQKYLILQQAICSPVCILQ